MADKKASKKAATTVKAEKVAIKSYTPADYVKMTEAELYKAITELRHDIVTLKRGTISGEVQNVHAYGARRKELARALTALNTAREVM